MSDDETPKAPAGTRVDYNRLLADKFLDDFFRDLHVEWSFRNDLFYALVDLLDDLEKEFEKELAFKKKEIEEQYDEKALRSRTS